MVGVEVQFLFQVLDCHSSKVTVTLAFRVEVLVTGVISIWSRLGVDCRSCSHYSVHGTISDVLHNCLRILHRA